MLNPFDWIWLFFIITGTWTHDHPLMAPELEQLGLPVKVGVPPEERLLLDLYPQPRGREAAVEYVAGPRMPPVLPRRRDLPSGRGSQ